MDNNCKPNVLVAHNYYQIPGGEDIVVENEVKLLEENGHQVTLYTRNNSDISRMNIIQKLLLPINTLFSIKTYREVKSIIKHNKIDILHVHNTIHFISPSIYYAAFSCQIPVVQTLHNYRLMCPAASFYREGKTNSGEICDKCIRKNLTFALKYRCYRNNFFQTLVSVIMLQLYRGLGAYRKINFICLTEYSKQKLLLLNKRRNVVNEKNIFVKPNFTINTSEKSMEKWSDYFIFVGRIERSKGIYLLLDAFKQLPHQKLLIVGDGNEFAKLKNIIKIEKLSNIRLLGQLDRGNLNNILSRALAIIVPSQCLETFGMVVIEAYSNAVPAIVGDLGNLGSLVKDNVSGFKFKYNSARDLIKTVELFFQYDRSTLGQNAYNEYRRYYSPVTNYEILNNIYNSIKP